MKQLVSIILVLASLMTVGCSSEPQNIEAVLELLSCEKQSKQPAFLISGSYSDCNETSNLFWFDKQSAKEEHIKLCALAYGPPLQTGESWAQYEPKCFAFQ